MGPITSNVVDVCPRSRISVTVANVYSFSYVHKSKGRRRVLYIVDRPIQVNHTATTATTT